MKKTPLAAFWRAFAGCLAVLFVAGCVVGGAEMVRNGRAEPTDVSLLWRSPAYVVTDMLVFWWLPALVVGAVVGGIAAALGRMRRTA